MSLKVNLEPFKRKQAARGKRVPRVPSIFDWFCLLPSLEFAVGSVAPAACPLVLAAARAPLAAMHGDTQNGNRRATTLDNLSQRAFVELVDREHRVIASSEAVMIDVVQREHPELIMTSHDEKSHSWLHLATLYQGLHTFPFLQIRNATRYFTDEFSAHERQAVH
jgi:hypothetical protein